MHSRTQDFHFCLRQMLRTRERCLRDNGLDDEGQRRIIMLEVQENRFTDDSFVLPTWTSNLLLLSVLLVGLRQNN